MHRFAHSPRSFPLRVPVSSFLFQQCECVAAGELGPVAHPRANCGFCGHVTSMSSGVRSSRICPQYAACNQAPLAGRLLAAKVSRQLRDCPGVFLQRSARLLASDPIVIVELGNTICAPAKSGDADQLSLHRGLPSTLTGR